jgi:quercetin dioxygenase-like cupin family protein
MQRIPVLAFTLASLVSCDQVDQVPVSDELVVVPYDEARFTPVNPALPDGPQLSVLWGDPDTGPSAMLMKISEGSVPLHFHSADYHLVVLKGTMKHWDETGSMATASELGPGSYWFQPGNQNHADACLAEECIVQIVWLGSRNAVLAVAPGFQHTANGQYASRK